MTSKGVIEKLEERRKEYILGARMRRQREVSEEVLGRAQEGDQVTGGQLWMQAVYAGREGCREHRLRSPFKIPCFSEKL
jgi:hypothetical protein